MSVSHRAGKFFKPATSEEIRRRTRAPDFDPTTRFYASADEKIVGYCVTQSNGRIGYPWSIAGTTVSDQLFEFALDAFRKRGIKSLWSAYRGLAGPYSAT